MSVATKSLAKVLILEDDSWFVEILVNILADDYEIKIANNPGKVFAILDQWWPDLILADVILGAKNLFVLLNEMQSYIDSRKIPIVILSSVAQQINQHDVVKFNVKKVIDKVQVTPVILRKTLCEIIAKNRAKRTDQ